MTGEHRPWEFQGRGPARFPLRGETVNALAQPYRFYLLNRVQEAYAALSPDERASVDEMLDACGILPVLTITLDRQIERADNLEVWGD